MPKQAACFLKSILKLQLKIPFINSYLCASKKMMADDKCK